MRISILTILLLLASSLGKAQEKKVYVTNTANNGQILVKWYSKQLWYPDGVNIYRKELPNGEWQRLNEIPIKRKAKLSVADLKNDSSLQAYVDLVNKTPLNELKGFALLSCIIKTIQSNEFAKYLGLIYEDKTIVANKKYSYKVMRLYGNTEAEFGVSGEIVAGKFQPGQPPKDIIIEPGHNKASIKWKPEEDRYYAVNIYRSSETDKEQKKVNNLPLMLSSYTDETGEEKYAEDFFVDDGLKNGVTYFYQLKSIDFFGRESVPSNMTEITLKDKLPPPPPYNIRKNVDRYNVGISWDIAVSEDLAGFNVYRCQNDKDYRKVNKKLLSKTDTSFSENFEKSSYYYYQVASVDRSGNEARSNKLLLKVEDNTPPAKPKKLRAVADTGSIKLSWEKNSEEDLIGYLLYRKIKMASAKGYILITPDYLKSNLYIDSLAKNIKNGFNYYVVAVDSALNNSEKSNTVLAKMPDVVPPEKPVIIKSVSNKNGVLIEWLPNAEPDLAGYNIYRLNDNDTVQINAKVIDPYMSLFTDRFAPQNSKHYYVLSAVDLDGNESSFSSPFPGMMKTDKTDKSEIRKFNLKLKRNKKQVQLNWVIEKSEGYKGVVIYRKEDSIFKPLTGVVDTEKYEDSEIKAGQQYHYKIKVFDSDGNKSVSDILEILVD